MDIVTQRRFFGGTQSLGGGYWISSWDTGISYELGDIALASNGNIYITMAIYNVSYGADILLVCFDKSGSVVWQNRLGGSGNDYGIGITSDSQDNVYVVGSVTSESPGASSTTILAKYNSSGVLQWQRKFGAGSGQQSWTVTIGYLGNIYIAGTGGTNFLFLVYNPSGTLLSRQTLNSAAYDAQAGHKAAWDVANQYIHVGGWARQSGYTYPTDSTYNVFSAAGNVSWKRTLGNFAGSGTTSPPYGYSSVAADTNGFVYNLTGGGVFLRKYNIGTASTPWTRRIYDGNLIYGNLVSGRAVTVDPDGNVYIAGFVGPSSDFSAFVAKYNSSGVLQWQRLFSFTGSNIFVGVKADSNSVYLLGNNYLLKLPADGSKTGTYGSYTYSSANLVDISSSITDTDNGTSSQTPADTSATPTLTSTATNLTPTVTYL